MITASPLWHTLIQHQRAMATTHLREFFHDRKRFDHFSRSHDSMLVDFSKNHLTEETLTLLLQLAREAKLASWIKRLFEGDLVNFTEKRPALHTALRRPSPTGYGTNDIHTTLIQMREFCQAIQHQTWRGYTGKTITNIVNIGIGGSDLGPRMAHAALASYHQPHFHIHFVSNVDSADLQSTLRKLDPASTLFIIASKTFTTVETMTNAELARDWLIHHLGKPAALEKHMVAVTVNRAEAVKFGISEPNIFEFMESVGGRYSLCSPIGLPLALGIGMDHFEQLLAGAHSMDEHFYHTPFEDNIPVLLALIGIWYRNFWDAQTFGIFPYDHGLRYFPAYLQQLDMESNGKSVSHAGTRVDYATGAIVFGGAGTDVQHSFFQLLHQGQALIPCDFIIPATSHDTMDVHRHLLVANGLAQTETLMMGRTQAETLHALQQEGLSEEAIYSLLPHRVFPGNKPSTTIMLPKLTPHMLGNLVALYEHKAFAQGIIWQINPFDQWGVELGKQLAKHLVDELQSPSASHTHDASTLGLMTCYKKLRKDRKL